MTRYVSMKLAVLKQYLDNTVQTIQQTWDAWFSDVLPTGVRSTWATWFGARQTEWDTMSTEVGNATEMAVQAAGNADSAAQNAQQKGDKGDDLHWEDMSEEDREELAQSVLDSLVFADVATCESIIDELT
ncbi:MAG: hypothetical protein IKR33_00240 [Bacteroidales bacterium]|nr:hypothetical protein [Bacteroidales bacterium]